MTEVLIWDDRLTDLAELYPNQYDPWERETLAQIDPSSLYRPSTPRENSWKLKTFPKLGFLNRILRIRSKRNQEEVYLIGKVLQALSLQELYRHSFGKVLLMGNQEDREQRTGTMQMMEQDSCLNSTSSREEQSNPFLTSLEGI